jgi:hypothetical protein
MSKNYFVCSLNGKPVHVECASTFTLESGANYNQVNAFNSFDGVLAFLQTPSLDGQQQWVDQAAKNRKALAENAAFNEANGCNIAAPVAQPVAEVTQLSDKQVAINLLREYRPLLNEVLAKVKANPLYAQVKAEFKKVFGTQFKTFFTKLQAELKG